MNTDQVRDNAVRPRGLVICEDWISLDLLGTTQPTAGGARVFVWADDNRPTNANWRFRY